VFHDVYARDDVERSIAKRQVLGVRTNQQCANVRLSKPAVAHHQPPEGDIQADDRRVGNGRRDQERAGRTANIEKRAVHRRRQQTGITQQRFGNRYFCQRASGPSCTQFRRILRCDGVVMREQFAKREAFSGSLQRLPLAPVIVDGNVRVGLDAEIRNPAADRILTPARHTRVPQHARLERALAQGTNEGDRGLNHAARLTALDSRLSAIGCRPLGYDSAAQPTDCRARASARAAGGAKPRPYRNRAKGHEPRADLAQ